MSAMTVGANNPEMTAQQVRIMAAAENPTAREREAERNTQRARAEPDDGRGRNIDIDV